MKNNNEVWKDIKGYEGIYQISNLARVKSLERTVPYRGGVIKVKGIYLKPTPNNRGYFYVGLSINGKRKTFAVHRLVADAFIGVRGGLVTNHINGDLSDNRLENLEYVTHRKNVSSCFRKDRNSTYSKFPGVTYHKGRKRWQAQITVNNKYKYLGFYKSENEARKAYEIQALKENGIVEIKK